jgi:hypothetical protein
MSEHPDRPEKRPGRKRGRPVGSKRTKIEPLDPSRLDEYLAEREKRIDRIVADSPIESVDATIRLANVLADFELEADRLRVLMTSGTFSGDDARAYNAALNGQLKTIAALRIAEEERDMDDDE